MSWIDQVKQITRLVYDEDYPSLAADTPVSPKKPCAPCAPSGDWQSLLRKKRVKPILHEHECDELAAFWGSPCELHSVDPLLFWQGILMGRPESCLARMALDYLSSLASSVDAERAFSRGALTVTHRCHLLSDVSMRNSIVLGAWLRETDLVLTLDLIEHFWQKPNHSQSCSTNNSVVDDAASAPNSSDTDP